MSQTCGIFWRERETVADYEQGEAAGYLVKTGSPITVYPLVGRLYLSKSGYLLLSVPNAVVRGLFDALGEPGAELPKDDEGELSAHITVMRPEEIKTIGGPDKVSERGHSFHWGLGPVKEVKPAGWDGVSKVWFATVVSPELSALRRSYGLSSLPHDGEYPFHLTIARRVVGVLRSNEIKKSASDTLQLIELLLPSIQAETNL